jgi:hypothetical protein
MNEFYVGYHPKAPKGIAARAVWTIGILLVLVAASAIVFATVQQTYSASAFDFGQPHAFEGVVELNPYPALVVTRPGNTSGQSANSRYVVVAEGKHGADQQLAAFAGQKVRMRGTLVYRGEQTILELVKGSVSVLSSAPHAPEAAKSLGVYTLTGQIVDSKCNFGVMNPGGGKVHRDCAVRCLSGGIPPAFVTSDFNGRSATLMLSAPDRQPLTKEQFLDKVAQPVSVRGNVFELGDALVLEVQPGSIKAL